MTERKTTVIDTLLLWWATHVLRFPKLILVAFLALATYSIYYTSNNLGVNTDTSELLSIDLPFQQNRLRWERLFPQDSTTILFVVEGVTAEHTTIAANQLEQKLKAHSDSYTDVYIPGDNEFFRKQGFLYLDLDTLDEFSSRLTEAQPFIGRLAENYSLEGLLDILGKALDNSDQDLPMDLDPLLQELDDALVAVQQDKAHFLSWQKLLQVNQNSERNPLRSIVSARPKLDFSTLLPAEKSINLARGIANEISSKVPGVRIRLTGEKALEQEEMQSLSEDTLLAGIVSLVLVCLMLSLGLRSFKLVICTIFTLLMGLVLTAGFAAWTVGHLNVLSVAFAVIFIGLGVDFAIHICLRYRECRELAMENSAAVSESVHTIGSSLFLCALTTSIGFFAFVPTDYAGVSELGFISGGGMFIGFLVSLTVLPCLLKIMPVKVKQKVHRKWIPEAVYLFPFRHAVAVRIVSIILAIAASFSLTHLSFDSNPVNLRDPDSESVSAFQDLLQSQVESPFALIALTDSLQQSAELEQKLKRLPSVKHSISLASFVAEQQEEKLQLIDDLNFVLGTELGLFNRPLSHKYSRQALLDLDRKISVALASPTTGSVDLLQLLQSHIQQFVHFADQSTVPDEKYRKLDNSVLGLFPYTMQSLSTSLAASAFTLQDIPAYITRNWLSADGIYKILIEPRYDLNITHNLQQFAHEVQQIDDTVTGLPVSDLASGQAVVKAFIQAFVSALILIFLILLIIMRSLRDTLLVIWPLVLAGLLTAAINVLLHNPFNFANIIVMPLLMGMGVDSGIHIMHRIHLGLGRREELLKTSTSRGVFFSSLTTLCSFTSLAFTSHRGISSMGLLLAVGISLTLICTLIVLPAFSPRPKAI